MTRIVPIKGREMVEALEDWLARARRGEVASLAIAAITDDGAHHSEYWFRDARHDAAALFGGINILRDSYYQDWLEPQMRCMERPRPEDDGA